MRSQEATMFEQFDVADAVSTAQRAIQARSSAPNATRADALTFDTDEWDEADIPPRPWIASGYLLRGAVTVVVGAPASGKSSLMVAWASALALGCQHGRIVSDRPMKVMTFNVEDDRDEQRRRFSAVLGYMGRSPKELSGKVVRIGTNSIGTLLTSDPDTRSVRATEAMAILEDRIAVERPDVLMLDPLVELHECEENDNSSVRGVMAHFRSLAIRYDMSVVLLHHTRKGAVLAPGDPDVARGASAVVGAARIVLTVSVMTESEAENYGLRPIDHRRFYSRVDGAKINAAPIGREEWFERQSRDLANGDKVAAMIPWSPPEDSISTDMIRAIEAGIARGSPTGPWAAKLSKDARSVKHLLIEHGVTTVAGQKQVLDQLATAGFVVATFKRSNRSKAQGYQTPEGKPCNVEWVDDADE